MKLRILNQLLKQLINESKAPTELDRNSHKIAIYSYRTSVASIILSTIFSLLAIGFVVYQIWTSPDKDQMTSLINKTDSLITKQSRLLTLSQKQIDSLVVLNKKMRTIADVMIDQFNLNITWSNKEIQKSLSEKSDKYNILTDNLVDLQPMVYPYKIMRDEYKRFARMHSVRDRLELTTNVYNKLSNLENLDRLIPGKMYSQLQSDVSTSLMRYRMHCIERMIRADTLDTTREGNIEFNHVINNVNLLIDSLLPHIEDGRIETEAELIKIDNIIKENNKQIEKEGNTVLF